MSARAKRRATPVTAASLRRWPLPQPDKQGDKEERGVALIIGGAGELPGSILLSGEAALRSGAGKLQLAAPASIAIPMGVGIPEARVFALPEGENGALDAKAGGDVALHARGAGAVLIGPGMLNEDAVRRFLDVFLNRIKDKPLAIDATALSGLPGGDYSFPVTAVLTPHAGEMAALTGETKEAVLRRPAELAIETARRLNAVVALKGATTNIATPDGDLFIYAGGKVGLATSGSGDILAGIVVGLLARGADPAQAAAWAAYVHGESGNRIMRRVGLLGLLARDLLREIPPVMNGLARKG